MQSRWRLALVVVAVAGAALGAEECAPTPGKAIADHNECCKMAYFTPSVFTPIVPRCMQKYPAGIPQTNPSAGPPSLEVKNAHVCIGECVFREAGLITSDNVLDKAATAKTFTPTETSLVAMMSDIMDTCYASYTADIDPGLECQSGSYEFQMCLTRHIVLNCPSTLWTASSGCEELRTTLAKCPMMRFYTHSKPRS